MSICPKCGVFLEQVEKDIIGAQRIQGRNAEVITESTVIYSRPECEKVLSICPCDPPLKNK